MIKDNLPQLKLHHLQSKSQVNNLGTPRQKLQFSFENSLDSSSTAILTPGHTKLKDYLTLLDESLDAKEITIRNSLSPNPYEDFNVYREHLEVISVMIKKNNPRLAFTISRGINGCCKAISTIKFSEMNKIIEQPTTIKIQLQDNCSQTIKNLDENEQKINSKDTKFFRSLSLKLDDLNFQKVSAKLRELHRSLKRVSIDIPELSKIPEIEKFDVHDAIMSLEKHVKSIQNDIGNEIVRRKLKNLPASKCTQTDIKLIEPSAFNALESLLITKEEEIFDWKKKFEILMMDKK